ncbi:MAG: hypothetical protein ACR2P0_01540 [Acidimicrobiales bacterium]
MTDPDASEPDEHSDDYVDELPEDLNAADFVGPYLFPNNSRRRVPGILYILIGAIVLVLWAFTGVADSALMNGGIALAGGALILLGLYHLQSGWDLAVDEQDALVEATKAVGFPVGHASAQMAWRGLRSRPTWRILLYSNESPPSTRGFVMVDGVDAEVITALVEDNPEDWAALEPAQSTAEPEF